MDSPECYCWDCQGFESELHEPFYCYLHFERNEFSGAVYTDFTVNSRALVFTDGGEHRNVTKWIVTQAEDLCLDTCVVKDTVRKKM
jgi:hypothetical protein